MDPFGSRFGFCEQQAQGGANAAVTDSVQRHSEPVGRLLTPHLLDAFDDGAQVVTAAHWGEHAKEERERERMILG